MLCVAQNVSQVVSLQAEVSAQMALIEGDIRKASNVLDAHVRPMALLQPSHQAALAKTPARRHQNSRPLYDRQ
jgi:hypothetical protein